MKATVRHSQLLDAEQVPFTSSLVLSVCLHSALGLWIIGSAWFLQPYRLASHTVYLGGDSPFAIDQIPGEGGAGSQTRQEPKEAETALASAQADASVEPSVEKFAPPVEKPVPPPPKPAAEKPIEALPPKPVVEKAVPPPPKPVVDRPVPPTPAPKPVVEKALPVPPKPPPEAMTVAQKETKPTIPVPPSPTATEVQQAVAKLRERQVHQEAKSATEGQQTVVQLRQKQAEQERVEQAAQQRVAGLRTEQADQQSAQQRIAALRARASGGGSEEGSGSSGNGAAGTGRGLPGGGRGTGTAGSGGIGTGGLSGIRLHSYQVMVQEKVRNAWSVPPQSRGLQAIVFLTIDRAGHVEQFRFVQRSGNTLFDDSLQRAIKQAEPLPPLPADYAGHSLEAELRFRPSD